MKRINLLTAYLCFIFATAINLVWWTYELPTRPVPSKYKHLIDVQVDGRLTRRMIPGMTEDVGPIISEAFALATDSTVIVLPPGTYNLCTPISIGGPPGWVKLTSEGVILNTDDAIWIDTPQ